MKEGAILQNNKDRKTDTLAIIFHSPAYDRVNYGLMMAKAALAHEMEVVSLFTFGALKRLVKGAVDTLASETRDDMKEAIKLGLEAGILLPISEQIRDAKRNGLRIHACVTAMTLFNLSKEDLIEDVDSIAGLGMFVDIARDAAMSIYV